MRRSVASIVIIAVASSIAVAACSDSDTPTTSSVDSGIDADAANVPDARADADVCPTGFGDAGFATLSDLPIAALCAESPGRLRRSANMCAGSIVISLGIGVDCGKSWLFDPATGALQAIGGGCNAGQFCTGGIQGFQFPTECFDGNIDLGAQTDLCPDAGGDAGDDSSADAAGD